MKRSVFLSTFLFAAVLSPITLYGNDCAPPADARLAILELRVGSFHGENVIEGFDPSVFSYDARFPESESVGVLWVRTQHPSSSIEVQYNGEPVKLFGQSVAKLDVPLGSSELTIDVATRGPMPDSKTYVVRIERVPVFSCTEQGIREAIARGGGPIYFDCDEPTTVLTEAEIVIDNDVILDGEGDLIVDGGTAPLAAGEVTPKVNGAHRVFSIPEGVTAELIGFTVTGGSTTGDGGGILNAGSFTLADSTVTGNSADRGGGVGNLETGTLTVVASTVSGNAANLAAGIGNAGTAEIIDTNVSNNAAALSGGGLGNGTNGTLVLTNSVVQGNTAAELAGGIGNEELGTITLNGTTVADNESGADAGGILNSGSATLNDSTVVGNRATNDGGGIASFSGTATLTNTAVSGNEAGNFGGGIQNAGTLSLNGSTVSENNAGVNAGGLANGDIGVVTLTDSTLSENTATFFGGALQNAGSMTVANTRISHNVSRDGGGGIFNEGAGTLTLLNSTVSNNATTIGAGGGILQVASQAVTLTDSNVSGNETPDIGGGIAIGTASAVVMADTTVSGNTAASGGGIWAAGPSSLMMTGSTVSDNSALDVGGGIQSFGDVTLIESAVSRNSADFDGGVAIGGVAEMIGTTISDNSARFATGGIGVATSDTARLTMSSCLVVGNSAADRAGIANGGAVTLVDSVVSRNIATELDGGGILNDETATLVVARSTVSQNTAGRFGGGIRNLGLAELIDSAVPNNAAMVGGGIHNPGNLRVTNTTVSGNFATAWSGGIRNYGTAALTNTTVSGNQAGDVGGGIGNVVLFGSVGTMTLVSTTVVGNFAPNGATALENEAIMILRNTIIGGDCQIPVPLDSLGSNIESPGNTCGLDPTGTDQVGVPEALLNLGPLQDNGGPTKTHALLPGSVAIDSVEECVNAAGFPLFVDQRGAARPYGPACDSGAFEFGAVPLPRDLCINGADRAVYESLEYIDGDGVPAACIDAAAAIGADCIFGSATSSPPLEGCGTEAGAVLGCFPNCSEEVIGHLAGCVANCTAGATGLSGGCVTCYRDAVACGAAFCTPQCVPDVNSPQCIQCRTENGCISEFDTCSGLPGDIDCSTGGTPLEYTQDFESLDRLSATALSGDGWLIFGQVFDADGVFKFNYGAFPAPNGVGVFSDIVTGEGSPDQGAQQLVVYNDYNCCDPPNQGHFNGTDRVTSLVFQEPFTEGNAISVADVGKTLEFSFDARRGNINDPTGSSTAQAFIQTVDPNAGFAQTNFVSIDMTNLPVGIWDRYSISLTIDAGLMGQYLEFGFLNTASNFEPSGVFYDNILFETGSGGSGGTGGTGGSGGTGGTGGTGGVGGMTGANPVITNIAWATVGACTQGTASDYTITITATDADNDPTDLMYIGDVPGCLGAIDGAVSTIICPNVAPFPGTVVAEDPGGNTSLPARFTIGVCETGDCETNPGACEL